MPEDDFIHICTVQENYIVYRCAFVFPLFQTDTFCLSDDLHAKRSYFN